MNEAEGVLHQPKLCHGLPWGHSGKNLPASAGNTKDTGGVGSSNPLQYSCLGNPKHRGAWQAVVHSSA